MDTAHWPHQDMGLVKPMEELISSSAAAAAVGGNNVMVRPPQQLMGGGGGGGGERRVRPQKEQALNCPRCNSTNTKFCYYNNYSLTQPRYFCKTCRRYWTEGGSLRNVPVGGGSRKNKRSSSSSAANASSSTSANTSSLTTSLPALSSSASSSSKNPKFQEGQDLNLAFPALPEFVACTNAATTTATNLSAMELLRSTGMQQGVRGPLNPFMPMHPMAMPEYPSGFGVQDFRASSLSFPLDHGGTSGGYGAGLQEGGAGRLLFPFEESRGPLSSNAGGGGADQFDQNSKGEPPGFWNGMMGGGGGGGGGGGSW